MQNAYKPAVNKISNQQHEIFEDLSNRKTEAKDLIH